MKTALGALALAIAGAVHAQTASPAPPNLPGVCTMPDLGALAPADREPQRQQYLMCLAEQARTAQSVAETLGRSNPGGPSRGDPARPVERGYSGGGPGGAGPGSSGGYTSGYPGGGSSGGGYSTDTLRR